MKKKLSYLFVLFVSLLFICNVNAAEYTCKYKWDNGNETITFKVKNGKVKRADVSSTLGGGAEEIVNWSEDYAGFSASLYSKNNVCPPLALAFKYRTEHKYYVSDYDHNNAIKKKAGSFKNYWRLELVEGPEFAYDLDLKVTLSFINQYKTVPEEIGESQEVTYRQIADGTKISKNAFSVSGYSFSGWRVDWVKSDGTTKQVGTTIKNESKISDIFNRLNGEYKSGDKLVFYAKWTSQSDLTTEQINNYQLGSTQCANSGYVWNKVEVNGTTYEYCNINNLTYVACGDAIDLPSAIPQLISFVINFLKILTPIILVVMASISMIKALSSSVEDEIKKAQKSLIQKLIAAAMVFFVVSIVQFVIFFVADDEVKSEYNNLTEVNNLSDCFNCLLNNNCESNIYYKTNVAGTDLYYSVVTGNKITFDNEYYVSTDFYKGIKNTDCEEYGYFDSYHPKAVSVDGTCHTLTETGSTLTNYTQTLSGDGRIVDQKIYATGNKCYYWEGRINDYIEISCGTKMVTAYYRGSKPVSKSNASKPYYDYLSTGKEGYQPRYVNDGGTWYELRDSGFKYVNRTTNLFGESNVLTQKVLTANNKCYYWEGRSASYTEIYCQNHNIYDDGIVGSDFYDGTKNTDCEEYGYFDSYHPKAVKVEGTCLPLTKASKEIINYTQTLSGEGRIVNQYIYSAGNKYYYWEGRINNYIEIPFDTEIVTAYYRGSKPTSNTNVEESKQYYNYLNTNKPGYQPRYVKDGGTWYELSDTENKYVNKTQTLWGEEKTITQKVLKANNKCYYWEGREVAYKQITCQDHMNYENEADIVNSDFYKGTRNKNCENFGYFGLEDGYNDSYHPKAVNVAGTCYPVTKTNQKVTNYTQKLNGTAIKMQQDIYSAGGRYYYWEGRVNDYVEIPFNTEIVTAYYRGSKPMSNPNVEESKQYYNYLDTNKLGYQPRYVNDGGTWYELSDTGYKYNYETTDLFGGSKTITQKVLKANNKCYHWEGKTVSYQQIECRNYYTY